MATAKENDNFIKEIISSYPLDTAIDWIQKNLNPSDVFTKDQLDDWARENG